MNSGSRVTFKYTMELCLSGKHTWVVGGATRGTVISVFRLGGLDFADVVWDGADGMNAHTQANLEELNDTVCAVHVAHCRCEVRELIHPLLLVAFDLAKARRTHEVAKSDPAQNVTTGQALYATQRRFDVICDG